MTPSRALTVNDVGGFHPAAVSLAMSARSSVVSSLPRIVAQHGDGRNVGLGVAIDEVLAGGGERHFVVAVLRREQREIRAVEPDAVEVNEIRVAPLLAAHAEEVELAILLVHAQQLGDVPLALGDLVLQLAGLGIVEVEMAPVVALAEPDELLGLRQVTPVDAPVAAFEEGRDLLFEDVAHRAGGGVGDPQHFLFVIARGRDEGELGAFLVPLHVGPFAAAAGHVVA